MNCLNTPVPLRIKRLHPDARMPLRATPGAACFDLHAVEDRAIPGPGILSVPTGLAAEVPPGYALKLYSRSGHGKAGICLANGTGIIDSDYRGEIIVLLQSHYERDFFVAAGERIAQCMLERLVPTDLVEVGTLSETARGAGGFGSTGA